MERTFLEVTEQMEVMKFPKIRKQIELIIKGKIGQWKI